MNTQAATTKAIDWKHVAVMLLRATWWLLKIAFKATLWLGAALIMVIAFFLSGSNDDRDDNEKEHLDHQRYGDKYYSDYNNWR